MGSCAVIRGRGHSCFVTSVAPEPQTLSLFLFLPLIWNGLCFVVDIHIFWDWELLLFETPYLPLFSFSTILIFPASQMELYCVSLCISQLSSSANIGNGLQWSESGNSVVGGVSGWLLPPCKSSALQLRPPAVNRALSENFPFHALKLS
jgi:hypothetical protein